MGFRDAVASDNLHLASDRYAHQHLIAQFLQARCSSWRQANSVKALKTVKCGTFAAHCHVVSVLTSNIPIKDDTVVENWLKNWKEE